MKTRIALLCFSLLLPNVSAALGLPNCVERIHKLKNLRLPVKKDVLRNSTGCLYTINWSIGEKAKRPEVLDLRTSEECQKIGERLERAWSKSLLFRGEPVAHCQTRIRIKCPDRKKVCRVIFQLPEDDPVYKASKASIR